MLISHLLNDPNSPRSPSWGTYKLTGQDSRAAVVTDRDGFATMSLLLF